MTQKSSKNISSQYDRNDIPVSKGFNYDKFNLIFAICCFILCCILFIVIMVASFFIIAYVPFYRKSISNNYNQTNTIYPSYVPTASPSLIIDIEEPH